MIPWKQFQVIFHNIPFFLISTIDLSSDLINFEENIRNFLISLWIRPLFTIIPLNSNHFHQSDKFGIIFDTRPCEIDDLAVSSRHLSQITIDFPSRFQSSIFSRILIQFNDFFILWLCFRVSIIFLVNGPLSTATSPLAMISKM